MSKEREQGERNVFGYLAREFEGFEERPLGDVDSLVLACLSYFRLPEEARAARTHEGMELRDLYRAEWLEGMTRSLWDAPGLRRFLSAAVASPRFRGIRVCDYVDDFDEANEKQFSAMTLRLPAGGAYVSFRGTDNTLVGWREDFNMAFETGIPSQLSASSYLERVVGGLAGEVWVGGHSKGGNLAVYAASTCSDEAASRLSRVFSHDGPGFTAQTLAGARWRDRAHLVSKTVPQSSLVGMLFERQEDYAVVESSTVGVLQHDPFSWVVEGTQFVRREGLGKGAGFVDDNLNQWISSMTREEREAFVEELFSVLSAGGQDTFGELANNWQTAVPAMLEEVARLDPARRGHITRALSLLVQAFLPELPLPQMPELDGAGVTGLVRRRLADALPEWRDGKGRRPDGVGDGGIWVE